MRPRQLLVPPPASHAPRRRRRCRASRARRAAARMGGSKNIDYSTQVTPRRGVTPRAQRAEEKIFRRIIRDNDDFVRSARCARHIMQSLATDGRRPRRFDPVRGCKFVRVGVRRPHGSRTMAARCSPAGEAQGADAMPDTSAAAPAWVWDGSSMASSRPVRNLDALRARSRLDLATWRPYTPGRGCNTPTTLD